MSNVYVWRYPHENVGDALRRFDALLEDQAAALSAAFGRSFGHTSRRVGHVLIGQVGHTASNGVRGWRPWVDHGSCGVAWSGICEDHLGVALDEAATRGLHETALRHPERIGRSPGSFALVSWDDAEERVCVTTGDTMSPPLWWTSGPDGWACGSRAAPLFELVGAPLRLDTASAGLFLTSSYHVSGGTFFAGTERIDTRQQVVVGRGGEPRPREYLSVAEYLFADGRSTAEGHPIQESADAVRHRTERQLAHSEDAVLELTGGGDSRCIAAAIARGGGAVRTHTGGAPNSPEVEVARSVAEALGWDHTVETLEEDRLSVLVAHGAEARRWVRFSEGLETIRQGLHWERFFTGSLPVFERNTQFFNGLHSGLLKPTVSTTAAGLTRRLPDAWRDHAAARDLLASVLAATDDATAAAMGKDHDERAWSAMFYWQRRCTVWGSNVMSVKDPAAWYWIPLVDRTLLHWSWQLMKDRAEPPSFIQSITNHNAPELASIAYVKDLARKGVLERALAKGWRLVRERSFLGRRAKAPMALDAQYFPISPRRPEMWRAFFEANDHAWKDLIDERYVWDLIERDPRSQLLWNLATVELVAQEFF